ncbi:MAG: hypothetical protein ACRC3J_05190 [Culicoidibacterales bacterium]
MEPTKPIKKPVLWAIIHFGIDNSTNNLIHQNRACIFKTKKDAIAFEKNVVKPHLMNLLRGKKKLVFKNWWFRIEYVNNISSEDERKLIRILETLSIKPITNFKYGSER